MPTPVQYSGLRSPTRLAHAHGAVLGFIEVDDVLPVADDQVHGLAGALGQRSRWALATPMMSMRLTMPLESSNIFSVRRLAVPRFVLRHIPQRRQAGQQPVHRAFGQAGALRQAL